VKNWVATAPADWANESYSITLAPATAYCTIVGANCQYSAAALKQTNPKRIQRIDQAYLAAYQGAASEQVAKAGFRLAHLLNLATHLTRALIDSGLRLSDSLLPPT